MSATQTPDSSRLTAFSVLVEELARYARMSRDELVAACKSQPLEFLCSLPDPKRGSRPYGRKGEQAIRTLVSGLLKREPALAARCSIEFATEHYKKFFLKELLRAKDLDDKEFLGRYEKGIVRLLRRKLKTRTYFLPCVIPESEKLKEFRIGPVLFTRTSGWFVKNEEAVKKTLQKHGDKLGDDLIQEISQSRWLGVVTVDRCDQYVSSRRAHRAVRAAIDVLRLFIGPDTAGKAGLSTERAKPFKSAALVQVAGDFQISASVTWGPIVPDAWFEFLNSPDRLRDSMGKAIGYVVSDFSENPVRARFLDALTWYGEACTEDIPNTAIIKAAACLERLTVFKRDKKLTETVSSRTAALIANYADKDFSHLRDTARELYAVRSDLMHGRVGPHHENELISVRYAVEIAREALVGYVRFLAILKQPVIESALRENYKKAVLHFDPKAVKSKGKKQKKSA